ncbi:flagellar M-ring protein FliF [Marivibrio halodurans]|uniref:Flagellar M-ring protein n=1 Tax=Marivibrio halodurans TaxID=2039722 RepID=A0A8J7RX94_9PROT|nr:flagellar basal-body MS-ring/collar protein FliF [Marivibrio halodurans]MBP5856105.1 flagellar M-ring protein FliF [Marivibrio halodurans]
MDMVKNLGAARLSVIAGTAVLVLGFFIFLATRVTTPEMAMLYGELSEADSNRIVTQLSQQNTPFELRQSGQQIWVPREQVGELRLAMAGQGVGGSLVGYEIFDRDQSLGQSSFVQEVNRLRALEGELARTITSLASVRGSRVHLVLPRRELFSRDTQEPTASIVLKMAGAQRLDNDQIAAIQHLVATAVPRLRPTNISIVDDRGTLLHGGGEEEGGPGLSADNAAEMRQHYETRLARRVTELLERTVGFGKVRVEVRADMDFSQVVSNSETFDPTGQVLRSSETVEESSSSQEAGEDTVTVGNNLPDAAALDGGAGGGASEQQSRTEERSNFEISKTQTNRVSAPGRVERLSVAVLVDGLYPEGEDGQTQYEQRPDQQMQQLESLVRSAVGFDAARGDALELVNMQFAELPVDVTDDSDRTFFGFTTSDMRRIVELLVLGVLGILIVLLVVRPLLTKVFEAAPSSATADAESDTHMITDQSGGGGHGEVGLPATLGEDHEGFDSMIDIAHIEGRVKASSMKKIGEIIEKHPEEAVAILRNWMYQDAN